MTNEKAVQDSREFLRTLDGLNVERACLVGFSLGGMIAQYMAIKHPKRVAALVLVSIPAIYGGDHLSEIYSADGLVAEVLAFVPLYVWSLAVSIAIFRRPAAG